MRKIISISILTVMLSLSAVGCSSGNKNNTDTSTNTQSTSSATTAKAATTSNKPASADLTGEVSSINGSEVVLKVAQMPNMNANGNPPSMPQDNGQQSTGNKQPPQGNGQAQQGNGQTPQDNGQAQQPPQNNGQQAGDNSQQPAGNKQAPTGGNQPSADGNQKPSMSLNYTGESKTIVISDGTPITVSSGKGDEGQQTSISVADIKQGDILQIWYSDKDKGTISKISIMQNKNK